MSSELQSLLRCHLDKASEFQRPPKNLRKSFQLSSHHSTPQQHTGRIFLGIGFQAWLGYLLASNAIKGQSKYNGKARDRLLLSRLEEISIEEKQCIARDIGEESLGEPVKAKIGEWEERCRLAMDVSVNSEIDDSAMAGTSDPSAPSAGSTSPDISHQRIDQRQGLVAADVTAPYAINVARAFPPFLCSAIIKDGWSMAMVQMSFPDNPSDDCQMTLNILPNKVEYLAMVLFGIHLESEAEQRYVVLGNGSRIVPSHQMLLDGADEKASAEIFGLPTNTAVQTSFKRVMEISTASTRTKCVAMSVSMRSNDPASLSLTLGLEESLKLRRLLFDV